MASSRYHNLQRQFLFRADLTRRFALFALLLFICTQLHAVMHHHDDLDDHPDCSICAVAHHQSMENTVHFPHIIPAPRIERTQVFTHFVSPASDAPQSYSSRAPPQNA